MKRIITLLLFVNISLCYGIDVVAHRGDNQFAPPNSVEAAKHAWFNGIKYVEADFYETKDKTMVGVHCNATLRQLTGDKNIDLKNLTEDLCKKTNIANVPSERKKGYDFVKVPTLDEFLWAMPPSGVLVFEAKNFSKTYCDNVAAAFKRTNTKFEQIIFISFNETACKELKKRFPKCKVLFLIGGGLIEKGADWAIAKCRELGVDGLDSAYNNRGKLLTAEYVKKVKDAGLDFWVWTVNKPEDFKYFKKIGVDGVTTDFATKFKELN